MKDNSFNEIGRYWRKLAELNKISTNKMNQLYDKFMLTKDFQEWENKNNMDIIFSDDMFNKFMKFYKREMGKDLVIDNYTEIKDSDDKLYICCDETGESIKEFKSAKEAIKYAELHDDVVKAVFTSINGEPDMIIWGDLDTSVEDVKIEDSSVTIESFKKGNLYAEYRWDKDGGYSAWLVEIRNGIGYPIKLKKQLEKNEAERLFKQYRREIMNGIHDSKIKDVKPRKNETKEEFISRFMKETAKEYPDEKQRAAIAYSYWNRRNIKDSTSDDFYNTLFKYFEDKYGYDIELEKYPTEEADYLVRIFDKKDNLNYKELEELLKDLAEKHNIKLDWIGTESGWRLDGKDIKNTYTVYFSNKEEVKDLKMIEELEFPFELETDNFYLKAEYDKDRDLYTVYYLFNFSNNLEGPDKEETEYFNSEKEAREFVNELLEMDSKEFSELYFADSKDGYSYVYTCTDDNDYELYYDNFEMEFYKDDEGVIVPVHHSHFISEEDLLKAVKEINPEEESTNPDELYKKYYNELLEKFKEDANSKSEELISEDQYDYYDYDEE